MELPLNHAPVCGSPKIDVASCRVVTGVVRPLKKHQKLTNHLSVRASCWSREKIIDSCSTSWRLCHDDHDRWIHALGECALSRSANAQKDDSFWPERIVPRRERIVPTQLRVAKIRSEPGKESMTNNGHGRVRETNFVKFLLMTFSPCAKWHGSRLQ